MASRLITPNSEAAIWARLMDAREAELSPEAAEFLLSIRFAEADIHRMHQLAERSTAGLLSNEERAEYDSYLRISNWLAVMQSKVRRALPAAHTAAPGGREQEWLRIHWREHVGSWIALDDGRMVGEATRARDALEQARSAGFPSPFLVHVTEPSELPFGGW